MQIRMAEPGDADAIAAIYRPSVVDAATSFEVDPPSGAEMARRMVSVMAIAPWLVYVGDDGRVLGYAYASPHNERAAYQWSVNVTVYIDATHHRRGIGRALYQVLFALLRVQGFYVAHGGITLPNPKSVGLHEALGFQLVGVYPAVGWKRGAWHDVGWWRLELQERPATPATPLTPAQARSLPAWAAALATGTG